MVGVREYTVCSERIVVSTWSSLPKHTLEQVFSYLSLSDISKCAIVCYNWYHIIKNEDSLLWYKKIKFKIGNGDNYNALNKVQTYKSKLKAVLHSWNEKDCSRHIYVTNNGFTIHRNPVARSSDGARGKIGFTTGRHCWEVCWKSPLGTVAVIGIATSNASLQSPGYHALLGRDSHSWGWNIVDKVVLHGGCQIGSYPIHFLPFNYNIGKCIRVILDCNDRTLAFEIDYKYLGVAFKDLPMDSALFPAISAVYGNTEVNMIYLGTPFDG